MSDPRPGQYMVLQFVPDSVRDERLNVGLVFADLSTGKMELRRAPKLARVHRIDPQADLPGLSEYLDGLSEAIAATRFENGKAVAGALHLEEHFQLSEPRPVVLSPSSIEGLLARLVGHEARRAPSAAPTRTQVRKWVRGEFQRRGLTATVAEGARVAGAKDSYVFDFAHESKKAVWVLEILVVRQDNLEEALDRARALLFKREDLEGAPGARAVEVDAVVSSPPGTALEDKVAKVVRDAGCVHARPEDAPTRLEAVLAAR